MKSLVIIFFFLLFFPFSVSATGVGFVPNSKIWFSPVSFAPGDMIHIYTVVINNDYYSLRGSVAFYVNDRLLDTIRINDLRKENAIELTTLWRPDAGNHNLRASFLSATAIDEQGREHKIKIEDVNSETISSGASSLSQTSGEQTFANTSAVIQKSDKRVSDLVSSPPPASAVQMPMTSARSDSRGFDSFPTNESTSVVVKNQGKNLEIYPIEQPTDSRKSYLAQEEEKLAQAVQFVTSTATETFEKTKAAIDTGKHYYTRAQEWWQNIKPYREIASSLWLSVTDHNKPKRVLIVVMIIFLFFFLLRRLLRGDGD